MADLTITEANVDWVDGPKETRDATETITAGDVLYAASSTTVSVASNSDSAKDEVVGIALNAASSGHPVTYAKHSANINPGATVTAGTWYVLSATGAISPVADQTTNDWVSLVGYATTASNLRVTIINTGVQQA